MERNDLINLFGTIQDRHLSPVMALVGSVRADMGGVRGRMERGEDSNGECRECTMRAFSKIKEAIKQLEGAVLLLEKNLSISEF